MWLDELALAHTIVARPLLRLVTEPLAYQQVAPAGFLAMEKLAVLTLGDSDLAFRFVPWLASIAALLLFWRVSTRILPPPAASFALALFAASTSLVAFAGLAKQYSSDVAAVLLVLWAGLELAKPDSRTRVATAAGAAALLVSLPAVLAGASIGAALLWRSWRSEEPARRTMVRVAICWTLAAAATVALSRLTVSPATHDYMRAFWARGFPPPLWADPLWIPRALAGVLEYAVFWFLPEMSRMAAFAAMVTAASVVPGTWWLWRRDRAIALLLLAPVGIAILAAALRILPLDGRASLWLAPSLILAACAGFTQAREWLPHRARLLPIVLALFVLLVSFAGVLIADPPPYRSQDLRPVLERVTARAEPGDAVYVYYGARLSVRFYGPRAGLQTWTEGDCHRGDTRAYFRELDRFRGRSRLWVIWTHANPWYGEPEAMRSYLSSIGRELDRIDAPTGATGQGGAQALLYDLSDPHRLSLDSADRHEIPAPDDPDAGRPVACGGPAHDASVVH